MRSELPSSEKKYHREYLHGKPEPERKWIITQPPDNYQQYPHVYITQGYTEHGVRYRMTLFRTEEGMKAEYSKTIKVGEGAGVIEYEQYLTMDQFVSLWPATEGRRLKKKRYFVPDEGNAFPGVLHVDEFEGVFKKRFMVERELENNIQYNTYTPVGWLKEYGVEVTGKKEYKNKKLAQTQQWPEEK